MTNYSTFSAIQDDLKSGKITCKSLVTHHLARIESKKNLNVFLSIYADEALSHAEKIDEKIKNNTQGRLAGMIVGLKDVICYENHPLQASSKILDGFVSQFSATIVERLLAEDAIIIGRQNCDEFAMGSTNENSAFGNVLNDADNSRVPGGSSGASAVAIQADLCQISIGSDTGGSVRQPASFCGVVGLKPTYSRLSRYGLAAYASSFDCIGVIGKSVEDIALIMEIIAGKDDFDSTVSSKEVPKYTQNLAFNTNKKIKIAYIKETIENDALQPEIKTAINQKIAFLREQGHTVEAVDFPLLSVILPTYYILTTAEASSNLSRYDGVKYGFRSKNAENLEQMYKKTRSEGFGKTVKERIMLGTFVLSASYYDAYYTKAQKVRRVIQEKTNEIFKEYSFILSPNAPTTAPKFNSFSEDPIQMYLADIFSVQANVVGMPAISIPCGKDNENMPIGLQIMADFFEEEKLMSFAGYLMQNEQ